MSPYKIEFGHVCEDPNTWEQRYEKKDFKNHRDMGKVTRTFILITIEKGNELKHNDSKFSLKDNVEFKEQVLVDAKCIILDIKRINTGDHRHVLELFFAKDADLYFFAIVLNLYALFKVDQQPTGILGDILKN